MIFSIVIKKKLASIKTELKCWESMFFRGHGRKPNEVKMKTSVFSCPTVEES